MRSLFVVIVAVVLGMASCAGPRLSESDARAAVHHLLLPSGGGGSITSIAPGYAAATRHQFERDDLDATFEFNGETFRMLPIVGGDARELRIVGSGSEGVITDDWVVVAAPALSQSPYEYDPFMDIPTGTPIVLVGYPVRMLRLDKGSQPAFMPVVLRSRVISERHIRNAMLMEGWEWGDGPRLICRLNRAAAAPLGGMSGGAAFVWNEARSAWIIVGIVYGILDQRDERTGEVVRHAREIVVIRPDLAGKVPALDN